MKLRGGYFFKGINKFKTKLFAVFFISALVVGGGGRLFLYKGGECGSASRS